MAAPRLTCPLPTCTLGQGAEAGLSYRTQAHWTTNAETQQDMGQHLNVHKSMHGRGGPVPQYAARPRDIYEFYDQYLDEHELMT